MLELLLYFVLEPAFRLPGYLMVKCIGKRPTQGPPTFFSEPVASAAIFFWCAVLLAVVLAM